MGNVHSWRDHEEKVSELCSESLNSIATTVLDLEADIEQLTQELEAAQEIIAELEHSA